MAIADSNASTSAVKQMGFFRTSWSAVTTSARVSLSAAQASLKLMEATAKVIDENIDDMADQASKTLQNVGFAHAKLNFEMREALDIPREVKTIKEYEAFLYQKKEEKEKEESKIVIAE